LSLEAQPAQEMNRPLHVGNHYDHTMFSKTASPITSLHALTRMKNAPSLEQNFSFNKILQPREARRLHELQLLDAATEALEVDEWDVMEVKGHHISTSEQSLP
jgi:hypothetical protein